MRTMNTSLISLYKKGLISKEEIYAIISNMKELKLLLGEK